MGVINFFKKRKVLSLVALILVFIVIITTVIFYLDKKPITKSSPPLKNLQELEKGAVSLSSNTNVSRNKDYNKMVEDIINLKNNSLSEADRSSVSNLLVADLLNAYRTTNDHSLYLFSFTVKKFLNDNYGDAKLFRPPCYDPICADRPQSEKIIAVIDEIKSADLPNGLKTDHIKDLTNYGYLTKDYDVIRVRSYLMSAEDILNSEDYKKQGLSDKIYNEIVDYVNKAYPKEYAQIEYQPLNK